MVMVSERIQEADGHGVLCTGERGASGFVKGHIGLRVCRRLFLVIVGRLAFALHQFLE